ncbi:MAG: hypothetical protein AAF576_04005, partial [Pseudomonadota bacterium]
AVLLRLPGAFIRALLVVWLTATPVLLLPAAGEDATEVVALVALFGALITFVEYASNYPSLIEFRHAPPFNRVRFISLFVTVFLLTIIWRGTYEPTAITEFVTAIGTIIGHAIDFPYSPVRNMVLTLPPDTDPMLVDSIRTSAGLSYLSSLLSLAVFVILIRLFKWPGRYGTFNVWVNLPTFDPTAGGDVVERLQRDARFNVALGFLLPFVIPAVLKIASETFDPISVQSPQTLIWMMTAWAFLPSSLFLRGIAMGRVAQMIEDKRRQRYAEFGEERAVF